MSRIRRAAVVTAALLAVGVPGLVAPASAAPAHSARPAPAPLPAPLPAVRTVDYLPGVQADVHLPPRRGASPVPLVVTVPGGGWATADRSGLTQLAEHLAARRIAVVNATYRVGDAASRFPVPAQDVRCAVDAAVALVRGAGYRVGPVVLLGHSAGAHLTSLAAFGDRAFATTSCPYPLADVDGWVGLSGVYDLRGIGQWPWQMMGGTEEELPDLYASAATQTYLAPAGSRPHLQALLVQGDADEILPTTAIATGTAGLLRERGYRTRVEILPGVDHNGTFQAATIGPILLDWLRGVRDCHR
ncbi:MAG: alpha/beta hydrolase [Kineosporiaceae bacterium]